LTRENTRARNRHRLSAIGYRRIKRAIAAVGADTEKHFHEAIMRSRTTLSVAFDDDYGAASAAGPSLASTRSTHRELPLPNASTAYCISHLSFVSFAGARREGRLTGGQNYEAVDSAPPIAAGRHPRLSARKQP
jgi:hypothetical protein